MLHCKNRPRQPATSVITGFDWRKFESSGQEIPLKFGI